MSRCTFVLSRFYVIVLCSYASQKFLYNILYFCLDNVNEIKFSCEAFILSSFIIFLFTAEHINLPLHVFESDLQPLKSTSCQPLYVCPTPNMRLFYPSLPNSDLSSKTQDTYVT